MYVRAGRPAFCTAMCGGPQEYITYEFVPAFPAVSCVSGSSNLNSFRDRRQVALQLASSPAVLLESMYCIHIAVKIRDAVQKTCLRRWTIGKSGERGSRISVLRAWHDDDYYCCCYFLRFFSISISWWSFTGLWKTANLLKSPGLFSVFWPISIMQ